MEKDWGFQFGLRRVGGGRASAGEGLVGAGAGGEGGGGNGRRGGGEAVSAGGHLPLARRPLRRHVLRHLRPRLVHTCRRILAAGEGLGRRRGEQGGTGESGRGARRAALRCLLKVVEVGLWDTPTPSRFFLFLGVFSVLPLPGFKQFSLAVSPWAHRSVRDKESLVAEFTFLPYLFFSMSSDLGEALYRLIIAEDETTWVVEIIAAATTSTISQEVEAADAEPKPNRLPHGSKIGM